MSDSNASERTPPTKPSGDQRATQNRVARDWMLIGASALIQTTGVLLLTAIISTLSIGIVGVIGGILSVSVTVFLTWVASDISKNKLVGKVDSSIRRAGKTIGEGGFIGVCSAVFVVTVIPDAAPIVSGSESILATAGAAGLFAVMSFEYYRPQLADQLVDSVEVGAQPSDVQFIRDESAPWGAEPKDTSDYDPMTPRENTNTDPNPNTNTNTDPDPDPDPNTDPNTAGEPNTRASADDNPHSDQSGWVTEADTEPDSDVDMSNTNYDWRVDEGDGFEGVGGMQSVKSELKRDVITPLIDRKQKAEALGISAPNIVFYGPPGTGKTFIAQALATELGLPFTKLSGADVQSKWINESAGKVKALFDEAKMMASEAGGAVIFLDELDTVLKSRADGSGDHGEDKKVVNEFLNHLEETEEHDIVFIGATNRVEALDEAGTRSGRIDKKIKVGEPDVDARAAVFRAQLTDLPHEVTHSQIAEVATETDGCVPADIEMIVEGAAKRVLYNDNDMIQKQDIMAVIQSRD